MHQFQVCLALLGPSQSVNMITKSVYACTHTNMQIHIPLIRGVNSQFLVNQKLLPAATPLGVATSCIIIFLHGGFIFLPWGIFCCSQISIWLLTVSIWPNRWERMILRGGKGDAKRQHWNLYFPNHILFFGLYFANFNHIDKYFFTVSLEFLG